MVRARERATFLYRYEEGASSDLDEKPRRFDLYHEFLVLVDPQQYRINIIETSHTLYLIQRMDKNFNVTSEAIAISLLSLFMSLTRLPYYRIVL